MAAVVGDAAVLVVIALLCIGGVVPSHGALQVGFYKGKCNDIDVESTINSYVSVRFANDRTIVPALLRLHFHDCFVRGCDASILLDGVGTEKTAIPNLSVRGYDLIDMIKARLERKCPGVVSCADIIAIAARDAVVLGGGSEYMYAVQTGRRDGTISLASEANMNLPGSSISASQAIEAFKAKGLSATDLVLLLGAHTVGITHCVFVFNRLFNFNGTSMPDPTMDPTLVTMLKSRCPQRLRFNNPIALDQATPNMVDNSFYKQIMMKRGILKVDQNIAIDVATNATVNSLANGRLSFPALFGKAMVRMGAVDVLTETQGQIRKFCRLAKI